MKASGLRGRGGAGFPTGLKWSFMPKQSRRAAPLSSWSTPTNPNLAPARIARSCGTIPHLLVEGCLIAGFAMGAHTCFIYIRGEFVRERERLEAAVDQAYEANLIARTTSTVFPSISSCTTAPAPTSAARRRRSWKASRQKGPAAAQTAVPSQFGVYRLSDPVNNVESTRGA